MAEFANYFFYKINIPHQGFANVPLTISFKAFTLNSVPPCEDEIAAGGIGRNFVSRDLLEATSIDDALKVRIYIC